MGYGILYLADATFPEAAIEGWLHARPSAAGLDGWPPGWGLEYEEDAMQVEDSTRGILEFLASEDVANVEIDQTSVRVRVLVPNDGDGWLTYRQALASAFRRAGAHGGTARLYAVTSDEAPSDAGFLVESSPAGDRCVALSAADVQAARASEAGREIETLRVQRM